MDYAIVVMRTKPAFSQIKPSDLKASERDKVWHVSYAHGDAGDVLTISRETGEVLSAICEIGPHPTGRRSSRSR